MKKQRLAYMALGAIIAISGMIVATAFNIGAQSGNLGDITVKSLTVVDSAGKRALEVGVGSFGGGEMIIYGANNSSVVEIGSHAGSNGHVSILDPEGEVCVAAAHSPYTSAGVVYIFKAGSVPPIVSLDSDHNGGTVHVSTPGVAGRPIALMSIGEHGGKFTAAGIKSRTADAMMFADEVGGHIGVGRAGSKKIQAAMYVQTEGGHVAVFGKNDARSVGLSFTNNKPAVLTTDKFGKPLQALSPISKDRR